MTIRTLHILGAILLVLVFPGALIGLAFASLWQTARKIAMVQHRVDGRPSRST
ncbi:MAG: hypothetical protein ACREI3_10640 [Nitrospirales bacterium]